MFNILVSILLSISIWTLCRLHIGGKQRQERGGKLGQSYNSKQPHGREILRRVRKLGVPGVAILRSDGFGDRPEGGRESLSRSELWAAGRLHLMAASWDCTRDRSDLTVNLFSEGGLWAGSLTCSIALAFKEETRTCLHLGMDSVSY